MGVLSRKSSSVDDLAAEICTEFATVTSLSTARGYVTYVLKPLGVVDIERQGLIVAYSATLTNGKLISKHRLLTSLLDRVEGVSEILSAIQEEPLAIRHIAGAKNVGQLQWKSDWPVRYRLNWLRAAGAVTRLSERESSERYPQWTCTPAGLVGKKKWEQGK